MDYIKLVKEWEKGRKTIVAFCAENNISPHHLYYWRKKIEKRIEPQAKEELDHGFSCIQTENLNLERRLITIELPTGVIITVHDISVLNHVTKLIL